MARKAQHRPRRNQPTPARLIMWIPSASSPMGDCARETERIPWQGALHLPMDDRMEEPAP